MRAARRLLVVAIVAGLAFTAVGAVQPAAANHINFNASGTLVNSYSITNDSGVILGYIKTYNDNGDKFTKVEVIPSLQGTPRFIGSIIMKSTGSHSQDDDIIDDINAVCHTTNQCDDDGDYSFYAVSKRINVSGDCVSSRGQIEYPAQSNTIYTRYVYENNCG